MQKSKILGGILTAALALSSVNVAPVNATNETIRDDGLKENHTYEQVLQNVQSPEQKYAPYEFFFFDQDPDTVGAKGQDIAHEVARKGFNPGYAHGRGDYVGSSTAISSDMWLSDSWFELFDKQVKQAAADGTHFNFADEFGWPSFQARGRVLDAYPELRAKSLDYSIYDVEPGENLWIPQGEFVVAGKLVSTENSSYVKFEPAYTETAAGGNSSTGWNNQRIHRDDGTPWVDSANPYNFSAVYTNGGNGDRWAEIHPYVKTGGTYRVYAYWTNAGGNATNVTYNINGTAVTVNQRGNYYKWNEIGTFDFEKGGENLIKITNKANGRVVVDGIKLVNTQDPTDVIVIDDKNSTNRKIGYLDSDTLSVIGGGSAFVWQAPSDGAYRVYNFKITSSTGYDGSTVNYLDSSLAEKFIDIAYKPYVERYKDYMGPGKTINGVFSDHEGDYGYKMAYSEDLEQLFLEKTGEEMRTLLPLLIDRDVQGKDVKVRFNWFDAVSDLYAQNISEVVDFASSYGLYYTMHTWEEGLQFQAGTVGDYFKITRELTMPGNDSLNQTMYNPVTFKETQSIAELEGRRLMNEHSALNGNSLYTPYENKKQANSLAANGVSHFIPHSLKMTRQNAQVTVTPDFYNVDPNWDFMSEWTDYARRVSYINANGKMNAKVLLLNPMDSIWALAEGDFFDPAFYLRINLGRYGGAFPGEAGEINLYYSMAIRQLTRHHIEHLSVDKYYVNKMTQNGGTLNLDGRTFSTVVMPPMNTIDTGVAEKLLAFAKAGGYVYYLGKLPTASTQNGRDDENIRKIMDELKALPTVFYTENLGETLKTDCPGLTSQVQFIDGEFEMLSHYRIIDGRHFVFVANNNPTSQKATLYIPGVTGHIQILDPQSGSVKNANSAVNAGGTQVSLEFAPVQSFYIIIDPRKPAEASTVEAVKSTVSVTEGWTASVDKGNTEESITHSFDAENTEKVRVLIQKGSFDAPETVKISEIKINGGNVTFTPTVSSGENGSYVSDGDADTSWENADPMVLDEPQWIECALAQSTDVSSVTVTSAAGSPLMSYRIEVWDGTWWKNVATLDTNSQQELNHAFTMPTELINGTSVSLTNWNTWSFIPNRFSGCVDYTNTVNLTTGERTIIELETVDGGAQLWVNGKNAGYRLNAPIRFDVTDLIVNGENTVKVRVANTIGSNNGNAKGGLTAFRVLTTEDTAFVADTSKAPIQKAEFEPLDKPSLPAFFDPTTLPLELTEIIIPTVDIDGMTYDLYEAELADFGPCTIGTQHSNPQPSIFSISSGGNAFGDKTLGWWSAESYVNFAVYSDSEREAEILVSYALPGKTTKLVLDVNGTTYAFDGAATDSYRVHGQASAGLIPLKKGLNLIKLTQNGTTANIDALLVHSTKQKDYFSVSIDGIKNDSSKIYGTGILNISSRVITQAENPVMIATVTTPSGLMKMLKVCPVSAIDRRATTTLNVTEDFAGQQLKVMIWGEPDGAIRPLYTAITKTFEEADSSVYVLEDAAEFDDSTFNSDVWVRSSGSKWGYDDSDDGKVLRLNDEEGNGWGGFLTKTAVENYKVKGKVRTVYHSNQGSTAICARMNTDQSNRGLACAPSYANESVVGGSGGKGTVYFTMSYVGTVNPGEGKMAVIVMDKNSTSGDSIVFALPQGVDFTEETAFSMTDNGKVISLYCNNIFVCSVDTVSKVISLHDGTEKEYTVEVNESGAFGIGGHAQAIYLDDVSLYNAIPSFDMPKIELPEGSVLAETADIENSASDSKWTMNEATLEVNPYGIDGYAYTFSTAKNTELSYSFENKLGANSIATLKFYSPIVGHNTRYGFKYVDDSGEHTVQIGGNVAKNIPSNKAYILCFDHNVNRYYSTGTGVTQSVGWHEFAVVADENGELTFYIDGVRILANGAEFSKSLGENGYISGIQADVPGWFTATDGAEYLQGAVTDIRLFDIG